MIEDIENSKTVRFSSVCLRISFTVPPYFDTPGGDE